MSTPNTPAHTPETLLNKLAQYAVCNCPEDDSGLVSYHSNCHRHAAPIIKELRAALVIRVNSHDKLREALRNTATLAFELMERAARIDRKLVNADGREPDCELGEIVRLRQQLSRNESALKESEAK